jgi:hypothetical protein
MLPRIEEEGLPGEPRAVAKLDGAQAALLAVQLQDGLFPNGDAASEELMMLHIR